MSGRLPCFQAMTQLFEDFGCWWRCSLLLNPGSKDAPTCGCGQLSQLAATHCAAVHQAFQRELAEFLGCITVLSHAVGHGGKAEIASWIKRFQHRHHLLTDSIAGEISGLVTRVVPDRQLKIAANLVCFVAAETQQRTA